jgi:hypothetical protein
MLVYHAQMLVESERKIALLNKQVATEHARTNRLESNIKRTLTNVEHMTVIAYAHINGISPDSYHSASIGKKAKKLSEELGYEMGAVIDPRFGRVNTYHVDVLSKLLEQKAA